MVETINKLTVSRQLCKAGSGTGAEDLVKWRSPLTVREIQGGTGAGITSNPIGEEEDSQLGDFLEDKDLPVRKKLLRARYSGAAMKCDDPQTVSVKCSG